MQKQELRFRLSVSAITIALIILSVFASGTTNAIFIAGLAMFALIFASILNIIYKDMGMLVIDLILIALYIVLLMLSLVT